jgi:hypothetical protein
MERTEAKMKKLGNRGRLRDGGEVDDLEMGDVLTKL